MPFIPDEEPKKSSFAPDEQEATAIDTPSEAPSKKQGVFSRIADFADSTRKAALNFNIGAGKGMLSTLIGIGELGSTALEKGYKAVTGQEALKGAELAKDVKEEYLQPKGTAQKIGFGTEQVAEFFVPTTATKNLVGIAEKVAGGVAKKSPKLGKAAELVATTIEPVVQAAGDVATTIAQRGKIDEEAKKAGLFSLVGGIAANTVAPLLKSGAELVASRALPATIKEKAADVLKGRELGKRVLETGISFTRGGLTKKMESKVKNLANSVDSIVDTFVQANPDKKFSLKEVAGNIISGMDESKTIKDLELIPTEYEPVKKAIEKQVLALADKYGENLDLNQVQKLKKDLGPGLEKAYKTILERPVKVDRYATMQFQKNLKNIVDEAAPEVQPMNKTLSDFITARDRLFAKSVYSGYLTDVIAASVGASATGGLLEDPIGAIQNGVTNLVLKRLGTSTLAKTASAKVLDDVNKILERPEFYQAVRKIFEKRPESQSKPAESLQR